MSDHYQPVFDATRSALQGARSVVAEEARQALGNLTQTIRLAVLEAIDNSSQTIRSAVLEGLREIASNLPAKLTPVDLDLVFENEPGPEAARFVEAEVDGKSVCAGYWFKRLDGYHALRIRAVLPSQETTPCPVP